MLRHKDGYVLKPLLKPAQAETEIKFYEGLATAQHSALQPFIPKYHGIAHVKIESYDGKVLVLEDVTGTFSKPCVMDVKIGKQTWDPFATASKRESEEKKYAECKRDLGFCITGFQVYDSASYQLKKYDKSYGKSLNGRTIHNAFLNLHKTNNALSAVDVFVSKVQEIFDILSQQTSLHLYSSSVLLCYDCEQLDKKVDAALWSNVHMIDFAHAYSGDSHEPGPDNNYLDGLKNLLKILKSLQK
ncbi:Inositol polyphosphate multikinase, partial [Frankliniella fusca]